jgi:hypothetical protein
MRVLLPIAAYFSGFAVGYGLEGIAGVYFLPALAGETLFSYWFICASSVPGALVTVFLREKVSTLGAFLLGMAAMLLVLPALSCVRLLSDALSVRSYGLFFTAYGILNLLGLFLGAKLVLLLRKSDIARQD